MDPSKAMPPPAKRDKLRMRNMIKKMIQEKIRETMRVLVAKQEGELDILKDMKKNEELGVETIATKADPAIK